MVSNYKLLPPLALVVVVAAAASFSSFAVLAYDPSPLQDFCVADLNSTVKVNGYVCKDSSKVEANDFYGRLSNYTVLTARNLPGLNTLGISVGRAILAPNDIFPPHTHPHASELFTVIEGTVLAGFVASSENNYTLFSKILNRGDVFVIPIGLVHFAQNIGRGNADVIASFNSQNPGILIIPNAVFGSNPDIPSSLLAKAFRTNETTIRAIQAMF